MARNALRVSLPIFVLGGLCHTQPFAVAAASPPAVARNESDQGTTMDQEITTCPQCGATVQAPARFCVTCGIRLPEHVASDGESEPVDPRAGWTTRDTSTWTTPPPGAFDFEDPTIIDVEPVPVDTTPPVSRWSSWPSQPERADPPVEQAPIEAASNEDDYVVTSTTAAPVTEEFEAVTADIATPDPEDVVAEAPDEVEADAAAPDDSDPAPPTEEASVEETGITPAPVEPEPAIEAVEIIEEALDDTADDFEPAGWDEEPAPEPETPDAVYAATATEYFTEDALADEGGSIDRSGAIAATPGVERANALLDELRALLPALVRETPAAASEEPEVEEAAAPTVDIEAIRSAAVDARGEISFDNFAALRATIDEATTKPRDVEVMLKLSQRVDDIVALIAERDRLQLAFDAIIEQLAEE
jgi:hypothetical protein